MTPPFCPDSAGCPVSPWPKGQGMTRASTLASAIFPPAPPLARRSRRPLRLFGSLIDDRAVCKQSPHEERRRADSWEASLPTAPCSRCRLQRRSKARVMRRGACAGAETARIFASKRWAPRPSLLSLASRADSASKRLLFRRRDRGRVGRQVERRDGFGVNANYAHQGQTP